MLQEPGHVGQRENPVPPGTAEALEPADQVAGRNMPRDRLAVQGDECGELRDADRRSAGKSGLEGVAQGLRIRGQGGHAGCPAGRGWRRPISKPTLYPAL